MKTKEVMKILEENKITNVGKNTPYTSTVTVEFTEKEANKIVHLLEMKETLWGLKYVEDLVLKKLRPINKRS